MAVANTFTELDGLFKVRYPDALENAIPELTYLQQMAAFKADKRLGDVFRQPVILQREHGFTKLQRADGLVTLVAPVAGQIKPAEVKGYQNIGRAQVEYSTIFSSQDKMAAFDNSVGVVVNNLLDSARHLLESQLMWGQSNKGYAKLDTTHTAAQPILKVDPNHFAAGLWNGMEGASLVFYTDAAPMVQRVGGAGSDRGTIASVDPDAAIPTITLVGASGTDYPNDIAAGDLVFLAGDTHTLTNPATDIASFNRTTDRSNWSVMVGLDAIMTSGLGSPDPATLFNISSTSYQLWKSVNVDCGGLDLSFDVLLRAFARVSSKGGTGEYCVFVSPLTFANLMSDQGALRRYEKADSPTKYEVGAKDITFYTQTGSMKVIGHPLEKQGFAHGFPIRKLKRIGTTDITFDSAKMEGVSGNLSQFFFQIPDKNGVEVRCYSEQSLFTDSPGRCFRIYNIINS